MTDFFKGIQDLVELARALEEKIETGELKADIRVQSRSRGIATGGRQAAASGPSDDSSTIPIVTPPPAKAPAETTDATPLSAPTLGDVGGLQPTIAALKELVALPLLRPDLLEKLGLEPPRGVLLVGPPGTGKTLTARALAEELQASYIAIVGSEIMGKYYGEAEARLRAIFEKATRNRPCLIFIDEIDSIGAARDRVEGQVEKRVVAQLLSLLDGFARSEKGIVVLAATNRPDSLDPALRRPGRFDREVVFGPPDREGRREILAIQTRAMPLATDVDLGDVADRAIGFVGADLKALAQKAAYSALQRALATTGSGDGDLSAIPVEPEGLEVRADDFEAALQQVGPSVLRSVEFAVPQVSWADIGGLEAAKQTLQEAVEGALLSPELYRQADARAPRGILLWGPPGTGKTLLAKAIATQGRANFLSVSGPDLIDRWVGASEQAVREVFAKARQAAPSVIFLDEIDTLAPARGSYAGDSGIGDRLVGQLLIEIDGLAAGGKVLVIGATNRFDALDPALIRAGRLELQLKIDLPDAAARLAILQACNRARPLAPTVDLAIWAERTQGWSGADLALLSDRAALNAVRRVRATGTDDPAADLSLEPADWDLAFQALQQQNQERRSLLS